MSLQKIFKTFTCSQKNNPLNKFQNIDQDPSKEMQVSDNSLSVLTNKNEVNEISIDRDLNLIVYTVNRLIDDVEDIVPFASIASGYIVRGSGTSTPTANANLTFTDAGGIVINQATLGNLVETISSTSTADDPSEFVYQNRVTTTNATVTTLHIFTIPASTTYSIEATVVARRTGGVSGTAEDGARYKITAAYKNVVGVATIIGSVTVISSAEDQGGWDATFDVTGATARLRVTGAVGNNVTWHMTSRVYQVST